MGLSLTSPFVMSSITMMSNVSIDRHLGFYKRVESNGAGAIVLPSINPSRMNDDKEKNLVKVRTCVIQSGLFENNQKTAMGFSLLGPTVPNILGVNYGIELARKVKSCLRIPVIGSVANIGSEEQFLSTLRELSAIGVDAIELNFSCPNVKTKSEDECPLSIELLRRIRRDTSLPISLKLTPYMDYADILSDITNEIDSVTVSNAYIGLIPPNVVPPYAPFDGVSLWAPTGVYGPFEKNLTFYALWKCQRILAKKGIEMAAVGGLVNGEDCIQALLIGANVVQISSAVAWKGVTVFDKFNSILDKYLLENAISVKDMIGKALSWIASDADGVAFSTNERAHIDYTKCRRCKPCFCCDRLCLALSRDNAGNVYVDEDTCSACHWCEKICPYGAIFFK